MKTSPSYDNAIETGEPWEEFKVTIDKSTSAWNDNADRLSDRILYMNYRDVMRIVQRMADEIDLLRKKVGE